MLADSDMATFAGSSKVLIFTAPKFTPQQSYTKTRLENQRCGSFKKAKLQRTDFKFDGTQFVVDGTLTNSAEKQDAYGIETDDESYILLEYDPVDVQDSVHCYLDSEFGAENIKSGIENNAKFEITNDLELQKEFEFIQAASQMLLTSTNSLCSSTTHFPDRKSLLQRKEKLSLFSQMQNTCTHQLTQEDIFTQQIPPQMRDNSGEKENNFQESLKCVIPVSTLTGTSSSSSTIQSSPVSSSTSSSSMNKIPAVATLPASWSSSLSSASGPSSANQAKSSTVNTTSSVSSNNSTSRLVSNMTLHLPKLSDKLLSLGDCNCEGNLVNMVCVVLQVNPVKEIKLKSGLKAGQYVPLSSIVVADESKSSFKLTLWRQASQWAEKLQAGDVIVLSSVRVEKWRREFIGQTTYRSSLYNLHKPEKTLSAEWLQLVSQERLDGLMSWGKTAHGYLYHKTESHKAEVKYTSITDLKDNTLVHIRGRLEALKNVMGQRGKKGYSFGGRELPKIVAVLSCGPGENINVCLWGQQADWISDFHRGLGQVWELEYLTAKSDPNSGIITLHSNPKSTKTRLPHEHLQALAVLSRFGTTNESSRVFRDARELIGARFSGIGQVDSVIMMILFQCCNGQVLRVKNEMDIRNIESNIENLVYVGCETCERPLMQDKNGILGQCTHCITNNVNYNYRVSHHFRPINLTIGDSKASVNVNMSNTVAVKLFNFTANDLTKCDHEIKKFSNHLKDLLICKRKIRFSVLCETSLDDNDFIVSQTYKVIDTLSVC